MGLRELKTPTTPLARSLLYLAHAVALWGMLWILWAIAFAKFSPWSLAGVLASAIPPLYVFWLPEQYWFRREDASSRRGPRLADARTPSTLIGRLVAYVACVGATSSGYVILWSATGKTLLNAGIVTALLMIIFLFWFFIPQRYLFHGHRSPSDR